MVLQIIKKTGLLTGLLVLIGLNSCYYDSVEDLYPQPPACDTTGVTYSGSVKPVIDASSIGCHSGSAPCGNISLANYNDIVVAAQNGSLLGTIRHDNGWSPMPKNGNKLDDCSITKIEIWVNSGTPNN